MQAQASSPELSFQTLLCAGVHADGWIGSSCRPSSLYPAFFAENLHNEFRNVLAGKNRHNQGKFCWKHRFQRIPGLTQKLCLEIGKKLKLSCRFLHSFRFTHMPLRWLQQCVLADSPLSRTIIREITSKNQIWNSSSESTRKLENVSAAFRCHAKGKRHAPSALKRVHVSSPFHASRACKKHFFLLIS